MSMGELNKIAGAFLGALLLFLLLGFFSKKVFEGDHAEDVLAYALVVEDPSGDGAEEEEVEVASVDYAGLVASANPANGGGVFRQCAACHKIDDGANGVGPHLYGVVGRVIGAVDGYSYSDTLANHGGEWDLVALSGFLENPKGWAPGTKMGYSGLSDEQDRIDLIAYLNEEGGSNLDLSSMVPAPEVPEEAPAEEGAAEETADEATEEEASTDEAPSSEDTQIETAASGDLPAAEAASEVEPAPEAVPTEDESAAAETEIAAATPEATPEETPAVEEEPAAEDAPATEDVAAVTPEPAAEEAPEEASEAATAEASSGGEAEASAEEAPVEGVTEEAEVDVAAVEPTGIYAEVSVDDGAKVFRKCSGCHMLEAGKNRVGPHLWGVVGRDVAAADGFRYSDAMKEHGGAWTPDRLDAYLEDPRGVVQGTRMVFGGINDAADRAALIKFLNENSDSPISLR
ncbi:MAG: c-type cytochrome [Pseudomonadota bacterium]